jgi:hypothetical protein
VIDLAPLDLWQVQNLLPPDVTAARARLVARQSRGNPFWALQLSASLDADDSQVPPLARTLTARLSRSLSAEAAAALAVVAAAGRIGLPEALAVLDHLADPAAAVDEAVLAGVVVETGGRLSVAHPLIGAAAIESLPPERRARLYRRLADASASPERYAHFAALAVGPGPDGPVADALDVAAVAAHARAGNAAAGQFAAQAVAFTPASDAAALVRRRIQAGELLYLAGEIEQSLTQLQALDTRSLATEDLERALPLLVDNTDTVHGHTAATAIVQDAVAAAGSDPRRRALVLALASDWIYGIRGGRRAAATEAISCAEAAGPAAVPALHRALVNLAVAKVFAAEGLDTGLLDRAERLEADLPALRLYDTADLHRGGELPGAARVVRGGRQHDPDHIGEIVPAFGGWRSPSRAARLRADRRAAPRPVTTLERSRCPSSSGCGRGPISRCASGRCGGCYTTPPPAPTKPSASTSATST